MVTTRRRKQRGKKDLARVSKQAKKQKKQNVDVAGADAAKKAAP
jgi:hypothetical protein